jgi:RNA polymerase sigma factor (sigma-70 family)
VVGWFYRVLRNAIIDLYRRRASEDHALEQWGREMEGQVVPSHEIQNEICVCLSTVMNTIKPDYAQVLRSVDLDEQRLQEFAQEHNISASNAGVRLHRARASFRKHLVRTCGACSEHGCIDCTCRRK